MNEPLEVVSTWHPLTCIFHESLHEGRNCTKEGWKDSEFYKNTIIAVAIHDPGLTGVKCEKRTIWKSHIIQTWLCEWNPRGVEGQCKSPSIIVDFKDFCAAIQVWLSWQHIWLHSIAVYLKPFKQEPSFFWPEFLRPHTSYLMTALKIGKFLFLYQQITFN